MRMLCYKCNHFWNYKGKNTEDKDNITCPRCMYKLILGKALVEGPSEQKLLIDLPNKKILPSKLPSFLPTTSFKRVYFPDGFDCLVHKDIAAQFKELTLEDLQEEKKENEKIECEDLEEYGEQKIYNSFTEEVEKIIKFKILGERAIVREIERDQIIRVIPRRAWEFI